VLPSVTAVVAQLADELTAPAAAPTVSGTAAVVTSTDNFALSSTVPASKQPTEFFFFLFFGRLTYNRNNTQNVQFKAATMFI